MPIYDIGDLVKAAGAFTNSSSVAADPSAVVFTVRTPAGAETEYTYDTDVELVKESTGNYYVLVSVAEAGVYKYRFVGTGAVQASDDGEFTVEPRSF